MKIVDMCGFWLSTTKKQKNCKSALFLSPPLFINFCNSNLISAIFPYRTFGEGGIKFGPFYTILLNRQNPGEKQTHGEITFGGKFVPKVNTRAWPCTDLGRKFPAKKFPHVSVFPDFGGLPKLYKTAQVSIVPSLKEFVSPANSNRSSTVGTSTEFNFIAEKKFVTPGLPLQCRGLP